MNHLKKNCFFKRFTNDLAIYDQNCKVSVLKKGIASLNIIITFYINPINYLILIV